MITVNHVQYVFPIGDGAYD